MPVARHTTVHVAVELNEAADGWRIARLVFGTGDRTEAEPCYLERPRRTFANAAAALAEAKRRATRVIEKRFPSLSEDDIVWTITPPDGCAQSPIDHPRR
jgi:hypothetical protein